jgi:hypothetical protein
VSIGTNPAPSTSPGFGHGTLFISRNTSPTHTRFIHCWSKTGCRCTAFITWCNGKKKTQVDYLFIDRTCRIREVISGGQECRPCRGADVVCPGELVQHSRRTYWQLRGVGWAHCPRDKLPPCASFGSSRRRRLGSTGLFVWRLSFP